MRAIGKFLCIGLAILTTSQTANAADPYVSQTDQLLQKIVATTDNIATNVKAILIKVNDVPLYLANLTEADSTPTTATLQSYFTEFGNLLIKTSDDQNNPSMFTQLNTDLLTANGSSPTTNIPLFANDLVYSSLLNAPYFPKDYRNKTGEPPVNYQYNFIKNASGISLAHPIPLESWGGQPQDKDTYKKYFTTAVVAESFGAYVLSQQYLDGLQYTTLQRKLIAQASDPKDWFAKVASESIGVVLRQMLMYESQIFIMLTQLLQTERQMVMAQVINTSVLLANNGMTEAVMLNKAQGMRVG